MAGLLLTERELLQELHVSRGTLNNRIRPELPIVRIGRAVRFPRKGVEEWIEQRSQAPACVPSKPIE